MAAHIRKYFDRYIILLLLVVALIFYIVGQFQYYTIDGSVMNQNTQQMLQSVEKTQPFKDFSLKDTYNSPLTKIYLYDTDGKRYVMVLEKSLMFNRYRVFWSLEVTSRMQVFDANDSFYSYSADLNYGKIYVYDKSLLIWKQVPKILIFLVIVLIAEDYAYYKRKHTYD